VTEISIIGLDIAKTVFQIEGQTSRGDVVLTKRVGRARLLPTLAKIPPTVVALEACSTAHHWGRQIQDLGHQVRLLPPRLVKAFVQRNKTDARDAHAIAEAAVRPGIHPVPVKSVDQQCARSLHTARDLLVGQRTQLINALRSHLAEVGIVAARGEAGAQALLNLVEAGHPDIPPALLMVVGVLAAQWHGLKPAIAALDARIREEAKADAAARRLMTIPFVGPVIAHATRAAIGEGRQFACGRDFAAFVGLTPVVESSGQTRRLGRISKAGDRGLRRLFVLGATAALARAKRRPEAMGAWLAGLLRRRPARVAAVALAAKLARTVWAILTSGAEYDATRTNGQAGRMSPAAA
jgi:transposase